MEWVKITETKHLIGIGRGLCCSADGVPQYPQPCEDLRDRQAHEFLRGDEVREADTHHHWRAEKEPRMLH